jgi:hypothetical protein
MSFVTLYDGVAEQEAKNRVSKLPLIISATKASMFGEPPRRNERGTVVGRPGDCLSTRPQRCVRISPRTVRLKTDIVVRKGCENGAVKMDCSAVCGTLCGRMSLASCRNRRSRSGPRTRCHRRERTWGDPPVSSVLFHSDATLSVSQARATLARMSSALAVQTKDFGLSLC